MPPVFGRWELTDEAPPTEVVPVDPSGRVRLPPGRTVSGASYSRDGDDLGLSWRDGTALTVARYFATPEPADLLADDGSRLSGALARHLAHPQPLPGRAPEPVARVAGAAGDTEIYRGGQRVPATVGTMLLAGDVLGVGEGATLSLGLRRGGSVVLGEGARLALYVLDGSSLSVLRGNLLFQSGSDDGAITVDTPVATLRLQGMRCGVDLPDGTNLTVVHMGGAGEASLVNARGTRALKAPGTFTTATSFTLEPSSVGVMDKGDAESLFAAVLAAPTAPEPALRPAAPAVTAAPAPAAPLKQALGAVAAAVKGPGTAVAAKVEKISAPPPPPPPPPPPAPPSPPPVAAPPPPPPPPPAMAVPPSPSSSPPPPPPARDRPPAKPAVAAAIAALTGEKPRQPPPVAVAEAKPAEPPPASKAAASAASLPSTPLAAEARPAASPMPPPQAKERPAPPPPPATPEPPPVPPTINAKGRTRAPETRIFLAPDMETAQRGGIGLDLLYSGSPEEFLGAALPDGAVVRGGGKGNGSR